MSTINEKKLPKQALSYYEYGWSIIPIPYGKKAARIKWGKYQKTRPDEKHLRKWFGNGNRNIAVVLGPVSGDLACRDFDTVEAYESWAKKYPDLAGKLPTVRTAKGYHVYFEAHVEGRKDIKGDDGEHLGELRGSGHYCLIPFSVHPEGPVYQWVNPLTNDNLLAIEPELAGFLTENSDVTERAETTERTEENIGEKIEVYANGKIEKAIIKTLPKKTRIRHRKVFDFSRVLYSMPEYTEADPKQFYSVVKEWHRRALPYIRTKEFEETWIDFLKGWKKIKWKIGENPMTQIYEQAIRLEPPKIAIEKYPNHSKLKILVSLCRELQRAAGESPFFLATRTAAKLLNTDPMTASRWFFLLETDEILRVVSKGKMTQGGGIATRFRYIAN